VYRYCALALLLLLLCRWRCGDTGTLRDARTGELAASNDLTAVVATIDELHAIRMVSSLW
jgi:hypothetical protein